MDKIGDTGVQWASAPSHFFATYPAVDIHDMTPVGDNGVVFNTSISSEQIINFTEIANDGAWLGVPYDKEHNKATMPDAIMYAATENVVEAGDQVGLTFTPYSTVLNFNMAGWTPGLYNEGDILSIYSIKLKSNTGIAGDFALTVSTSDGDVSATATAGSASSITLTPHDGELRLVANKGFKFNVFTVPVSNTTIQTGWELELVTSHGTYAYPLNKAASANTTLVPGKIHKINIPAIPITGETAADGPTNNWITRVPTNVYVSELSVPGAWYSSDPAAYQGGSTINELYEMGVRAFHIDCRLTKMGGDTNYSLLCAGTDKAFKLENGQYHVNGPSVLSHLQTINSLINGKSEYAIVVITFAEKGIGTVRDPDNGNFLEQIAGGKNTNATSSINPKDILNSLKTVLSDASLTNLYGRNTGEKITSMTTINEVLGKFIVKINTSTLNFATESYPVVPNALLSFASLAPENDTQNDITAGTFKPDGVLKSKMYWGKEETDLTYYYYQAQRTYSNDERDTEFPNYTKRQEAIEDIIAQSDDIYTADNYRHNGWYQMGVGGSQKDSGLGQTEDHKGLATTLNSHLLGEIQNKLDEVEGYHPSPVGIVLMNYCQDQTGQTNPTTGKETGLIRAIIKMNDKFRMLRSDLESTTDLSDVNPETRILSFEETKKAETDWVKVK